MRPCCCPCTEFGWGRGRFCRAEQLQNWALTREIILVGSQEEQILGAAAPDPRSHNAPASALVAQRLCVSLAANVPGACPHTGGMEPAAEQGRAGMNTKTKPAWSSFRPDHLESILSLTTCKLSDFYLDYLHLQAVIRELVLSSVVFNFFPYTHNLPRRFPFPPK